MSIHVSADERHAWPIRLTTPGVLLQAWLLIESSPRITYLMPNGLHDNINLMHSDAAGLTNHNKRMHGHALDQRHARPSLALPGNVNMYVADAVPLAPVPHHRQHRMV